MEEKYKDLVDLFENNKFQEFIDQVQSLHNLPPEDSRFLQGYLGAAYNNIEKYEEAVRILEKLKNEEGETNAKTLYRLSFSYFFIYENDVDDEEAILKAAYFINKSFNLENPKINDYRRELAVMIFYQSAYITPNYIEALFEITKDYLEENPEYYYYYAEAYFMLYLNSKKEMYYQRSLANYLKYLNLVPENENSINRRIEQLTQIFNENNNNIV